MRPMITVEPIIIGSILCRLSFIAFMSSIVLIYVFMKLIIIYKAIISISTLSILAVKTISLMLRK